MIAEVILEVGAEGGSLTLLGIRTGRGWRFRRGVREQIDEDASSHASDWVDSWQDALVILDRYPWRELYPITVHREFRQQVWAAVEREFGHDPSGRRAEQWRRLCDPS